MARILKTEAFVVKKMSLLNKDTIITLFSEEKGKIGVFAKGIKKITSRRLPHIQTGNLIEVILSRKGDYSYLQETKLISHFSDLKKNNIKSDCLYFMLFILDRLLPENQKEEPVYRVFKKFVVVLTKEKKDSRQLLVKYLNKILRILGYTTNEMLFSDLKREIEEIINEKIPAFII